MITLFKKLNSYLDNEMKREGDFYYSDDVFSPKKKHIQRTRYCFV